MCGYVACEPECSGSVEPQQSGTLPDDGRLLPKHVGASIKNEGVCGYVACVPECRGSVEPRHSGTQAT
jgi:hypothetical protein